MGEQIADGDFARHVRVVELEPGQVFGDRIVPADLALVHQHADRRGGHRLGGGADGEAGVVSTGCRLAQLVDAVALGEDDLAVLDDGDGEAGAPVLEGLRGVGIEGGERGRWRAWWGLIGADAWAGAEYDGEESQCERQVSHRASRWPARSPGSRCRR